MALLKKGCLLLLAAALLAGIVPVLWRNAVKVYYRQAIYDQVDAPPRPVAVVFGAAVYGNGRLSPVLRDRVETAIALYKSGQIGRIIMSGDNDTVHYDEPGAMMAYAIERGVSPADVVTDRAGRRTYDTCYRAHHVFDVREAILVTQAFHLPRALLTCEGLGIEAVGAVADQRPYRGARWYELRETAATLVAAWDLLRREPPRLHELAQEEETGLGWPALAGGN